MSENDTRNDQTISEPADTTPPADWSRMVDTLAAQLVEGGEVTLEPTQTRLVYEALRRSAADQIHIATLQRRLERYVQSLDDLEMQADLIVNRLTRSVDRPEIDTAFSYENSRQIRGEIARSIEQAQTSADVLVAVLSAALRVLPLL